MIALIKKLFPDVSAEQEAQLKERLEKQYKPANTYTQLETELASVKTQLASANDTLKSFEGKDIDKIQKAAKDWEEKYNAETTKLQSELQAMKLDTAAEKLFSGVKFTSDRVKSSVKAEFLAKEFKLENDEFVGGKEWLEELKKNEPATFATEEKPGIFMDKTSGGASGDAEAEVFAAFGV